MAISKEFMGFLEEQFAVMGDVRIKPMFGGAGMFRDGLMFALATSEGKLAMKSDQENLAFYQGEACEEWEYIRPNGKRITMGYWFVPERLYDDSDEMRQWCEQAFTAAARLDAAKPPGQRKLKAGFHGI